jgi:hypothetical protein
MDIPLGFGGFGAGEVRWDSEGFGAFGRGFGEAPGLVGALVVGVGDGRPRSLPGAGVLFPEGVAKEIRPPGAELPSVVGSADSGAGSPD